MREAGSDLHAAPIGAQAGLLVIFSFLFFFLAGTADTFSFSEWSRRSRSRIKRPHKYLVLSSN